MELSPQSLPLAGLALTLITGLFSGAVFFVYSHYKTRMNESQGPRLNAAQALVSPTPWRAYVDRLKNTLDRLDCWMGRLDEPSKLFSWCLGMAFIYPFSFLLIGWLLEGPATIGSAKILPSSHDFEILERILLLVSFLAIALTLRVYFANGKFFINIFVNFINKFLITNTPLSRFTDAKRISSWTIALILFGLMYSTFDTPKLLAGICFVVALAKPETEVGFATIILAGAALLGGAGALVLQLVGAETAASAVAGAAAAALVGAAIHSVVSKFAPYTALAATQTLATFGSAVAVLAIAGAVLFWLGGLPLNSVQTTTLLLFWAILPFTNAVFDWASWWVSRYLGNNLVKVMDHPLTPTKTRTAAFIKDISIDLIVALFLLVALTWTMPRAIHAWSDFVMWVEGGEPPLDLASYLCAAAKAPLTDGLWATGMLFSTLIPTAAHLTLLLLAFILWPFQPRTLDHQRAAHILENHRPPEQDLLGVGEEARVKKWPAPAPLTYAIPNDINRKGAYDGPLHPDTVNTLSWKLGVRRPAYYAAAFLGLSALLYYGIGAAIASWQPAPRILLMIAGFTKKEADSCFAL